MALLADHVRLRTGAIDPKRHSTLGAPGVLYFVRQNCRPYALRYLPRINDLSHAARMPYMSANTSAAGFFAATYTAGLSCV